MAELYSKLKEIISRSKLDLDDVTGQYRVIVDRALGELAERDSELSMIASEALSSKGKRVRSIVALLTCEAVCGSYEKAIPVAMAYELAHAASLVQDDIIDDSPLRRNRPTTHVRYGMTRAILVSDYLIFDIFSELAKYRSIRLSKNRLAQLLLYFANSAKMTAKGEFHEIDLAARGTVEESEYLQIVGQKTAALFAASAASGALVGGAGRKIIDSMYQFGHNLGLSFQIGDDILDIIGDVRETGKPVFKDLQNNTSNIVIINALSRADIYGRNLIYSMLWKKWFARSDVRKIVAILKELGSIDYAMSLGNKYSENCRDLLRCLPSSMAKDRLERLTRVLEFRRE